MAAQTDSGPRPQLQRVPPNDPALEANLLGAAMLNRHAAETVADLPPETWYTPRHQTVAAAIAELVDTGQPTDTGTVCAHLHQTGQLGPAGGYPAVVAYTADTPTTGSHPNWADRLSHLRRRRHLLGAAAELIEAVYRGARTDGLAALITETAHTLDGTGPSTWDPVNLADVLAGEGPDLEPAVLARTDGINLVYPGKVHAVNAEPEAGKSWLCCHAAAQQIANGQHVIYLDFEADAVDITSRLLTLGVQPAAILEQFHYIRPDTAATAGTVGRVLAAVHAVNPTLVVVDGVTEVMASAGLSIKDNDDIARLYTMFPRPVAAAGPAVILIDHLVKDRENQGRWGIGAAHKLAGIDGAAYKLEAVQPFAIHQSGLSKLVISKDRHGRVRTHATAGTNQQIAAVHFDTQPGGGMRIRLEPPDHNQAAGDGPTHCREAVIDYLARHPEQEISLTELVTRLRADGKSYRRQTVLVAAEQAIGRGLVHARTGPRNSRLLSHKNHPNDLLELP